MLPSRPHFEGSFPCILGFESMGKYYVVWCDGNIHMSLSYHVSSNF